MAEDKPDPAQQNVPLMRNPVFLTALFGGIIAAFANAYVAFMNNNTLVDLESHKEAEEQLIEGRKAEFTRLLEISKLEIDPAKKKIKAFCEMLLITDGAICKMQTIVAASKGSSPKNTEEFSSAAWDSPWVGGGHNQQDVCTSGIAQLSKEDRYKGKLLTIAYVAEDSRKDFLGHVEYKYHCNYRVSNL